MYELIFVATWYKNQIKTKKLIGGAEHLQINIWFIIWFILNKYMFLFYY